MAVSDTHKVVGSSPTVPIGSSFFTEREKKYAFKSVECKMEVFYGIMIGIAGYFFGMMESHH